MNRSTHHIAALTSLRFFAAMLVVVFHHGQAFFAGAPDLLQNVIRGGYVGVPFFFILSGFILAYNYVPQARANKLEARRFWVARFARIYPVYVFSLLLAAPLFLAALSQLRSLEEASGRFALHALASGALVQSWIPLWAFAWNGPAWSLSVEAFFYLTFPFLLKGLSPHGRWWALGTFTVLGIAAVALRKLMPSVDAVGAAQKMLGWSNPLLWLPLFLVGICVGERHLALCEAGKPARLHRHWNGALTAGVAILILSLMAANLQRLSQLLYCYALTPLCALLIYFAAHKNNWFSALLSGPTLVLFGESSYSLYILHRPIHDWFVWLAKRGMPSTETALGFGLYVGACLATSVLALRWIEYPCRDWIKIRFGSPMRRKGPHGSPEICETAIMR